MASKIISSQEMATRLQKGTDPSDNAVFTLIPSFLLDSFLVDSLEKEHEGVIWDSARLTASWQNLILGNFYGITETQLNAEISTGELVSIKIDLELSQIVAFSY